MNDKWAAAFNLWMDEYVNDPDSFSSVTAGALQHLREKLNGEEPTYGQLQAATFQEYIEKV